MATLTVNYIAYDKARHRRNGSLQKSVISSLSETLSDNEDYAVSVLPTLEHEGKVLHFAFLAASGTTEGSLLSFNAAPQNIPVGEADIRVTVVYLSENPGNQSVVTDAFNLNKADFTNSDFIDVLTGTQVDEPKTATANESGTVSSENPGTLKARDSVDGMPFSVWKSFPGESTVGNRESLVQQSQNGYLFAFYGGN